MDELYKPLHSMFLDFYVHSMDVWNVMFVLSAFDIMHRSFHFGYLSCEQVLQDGEKTEIEAEDGPLGPFLQASP